MKGIHLVRLSVLAVLLAGIALALGFGVLQFRSNRCAPAIEFIHVPPGGSFENLKGRVRCVKPADYKVAVYTYASGWWTKPYWAWPPTTIKDDGSWSCDITAFGAGQFATRIAAFLVPNGYNPWIGHGEPTLPAELSENAVADVMVEREEVKFRRINFSGYTWHIKASETPVGPGPNYFSDREEDVWVDEDGRLHLRIAQRDGQWYCTEVVTEAPLDYGRYVFRLASRVDQLDRNIVLGLFTWDETDPAPDNREIDIELARWGQMGGENAQYTVQPSYHGENVHRFQVELGGENSTHGFDWRPDHILFYSLHGHPPFPGPEENVIASWTYTGYDIPSAGRGNARINLWLFKGRPPANGEEAEVIIEAFEFVPQTE
ncbi:MAG: hypothetical protein CVU38_07720 [Chloroflexi bacterium HGW-Chloroflexi-1]|nr:MAG: hypothetical protein CVU38_07720 [Chloroflexi bacterium HGW-Chloroflexi-1]